jgi:hypothetical protein
MKLGLNACQGNCLDEFDGSGERSKAILALCLCKFSKTVAVLVYQYFYFFSMYVLPESGLLYFLLAKSTHIVKAYKEGQDIVVS